MVTRFLIWIGRVLEAIGTAGEDTTCDHDHDDHKWRYSQETREFTCEGCNEVFWRDGVDV